MDFSHMTAEDLLAELPNAENTQWEFKSASVLLPSERGAFKKELGRQVSAFANSGGGYLAIGISDPNNGQRQLEACPQLVGNQAMKDYLSTLTRISVDRPISAFEVHRLPFRDEGPHSIFVIDVKDSPLAPHQARELVAYYYRTDGHTIPAPHFHLELLRNRFTKATLSVAFDNWSLTSATKQGSFYISTHLSFVVTNTSMQYAKDWGLLIKSDAPDNLWSINGRKLLEGAFLRSNSPTLLPMEEFRIRCELNYVDAACNNDSIQKALDFFGLLKLPIYPISHNDVGQPLVHTWGDEAATRREVSKLKNSLMRHSIP